MPATDPFIICKINQQQERKDYSLSKDGPCSSLLLITDRRMIFDFPPTISSAFAVPGGPEGRRLYPRGRSGVGMSRIFVAMDVQHQSSAKQPRSLTEDSPDQEGKISAQASCLETPAPLLITNGECSIQLRPRHTAGLLESSPQDFDQATRGRCRPSHPCPRLHCFYPPLTQPRLGVRSLRMDQCIHPRYLH